jgi:hypothetical protein
VSKKKKIDPRTQIWSFTWREAWGLSGEFFLIAKQGSEGVVFSLREENAIGIRLTVDLLFSVVQWRSGSVDQGTLLSFVYLLVKKKTMKKEASPSCELVMYLDFDSGLWRR